MASGTPVVTTDCGGIRDYVIDGYNALLVRPGDPNAVAEAVLKILKDNNFKYLIRIFQLQARCGIASSRYKKLFKDVQLKPEEVYELCKLSEGCITSRCNYRYVLSCLMRKMRKLYFR